MIDLVEKLSIAGKYFNVIHFAYNVGVAFKFKDECTC